MSMLVRTGYTFSAYFSYKFSTLIMQSNPPAKILKQMSFTLFVLFRKKFLLRQG